MTRVFIYCSKLFLRSVEMLFVINCNKNKLIEKLCCNLFLSTLLLISSLIMSKNRWNFICSQIIINDTLNKNKIYYQYLITS